MSDSTTALRSGGPVVDADLSPIAEICAGNVTRASEAGKNYILMERLRFLVRGVEQEMDALLCVNYPNPSYPTKLYLPNNLGLGLNWNENAYVLGRQWFSWSWKDVSPNQPSIAILAGHLGAFR